MFGYVQVRKPELKVKDYEVYRGFYCGLCRVLKEQYGFLGEMTLTYDMTFLVILLTSVYDLPVKKQKKRCMMHPAAKHLLLSSEGTEYAAHLNLILSYYHFLDDKEDEGSQKAWFECLLYQRKFFKAGKRYRKKARQIKQCMNHLSVLEKRRERNIHQLADCFGRLMMVLFSYREDAFADYMKTLGYHLGCFIYIMDAYEDREQDRKRGCFNPFLQEEKESGLEKKVEQMLFYEISEAAAAYQKLPCVAYQDILGNILYAGVWNRFDQMRLQKRQEEMKHERPI